VYQARLIGCGNRNMINYQRRINHPHRGHPTAKISSMNRSYLAQIRRVPNPAIKPIIRIG
jgi:hypothetical protein